MNLPHPLEINARASAVQPSPTLAISTRVGELSSAGRKIFNFASGQPDFPPPAPVAAAVNKRLDGALVGYSPAAGFPALRDAAATELSAYHDVEITRAQLVVSCGAKHSLANLLAVTLAAGDEVVIAAPYWVSYPEMVRIAGGVPKILECPRSQGFKLTPEQLRDAVGPKTKFLVLNSPNNPTGVSYSHAELRALAEALAEAAPQTWILSDDIYRKLTYGTPHASIVKACRGIPGIEDQIVLIDGVSKSHAMTGWRIGFLAAPVAVAAAVTAIQGQSTSGASTPAQWAALTAITDDASQTEVASMLARFTERRATMLAGLRTIGLEFIDPDGAFYVFPDFSAFCGSGKRFADDMALATFLLEEKGLATIPGMAFGAPGYLRLSFACAKADIEEGSKRLHDALESL